MSKGIRGKKAAALVERALYGYPLFPHQKRMMSSLMGRTVVVDIPVGAGKAEAASKLYALSDDCILNNCYTNNSKSVSTTDWWNRDGKPGPEGIGPVGPTGEKGSMGQSDPHLNGLGLSDMPN